MKDSYAFDAEKGVFSGWDESAKAYTDMSSWGYELDERGFAQDRPDAAASALGLPGDEGVLRALHAGDGRDDLRLQRRKTSSRPPS